MIQSLNGRGISISEISQVTGTPPESLRRHFAAHMAQGRLITRPDPDDKRVTRYLTANLDAQIEGAHRIAAALNRIGSAPAEVRALRPFSTATCNALIDVLQAFSNFMDSRLRIRGFKIAIVIQQASTTGEGITASQIARQSGAPLETVRRYLLKYQETGNLITVEDPNDDRASRVLYRDPDTVNSAFRAMAAGIDQVNWSLFNTN